MEKATAPAARRTSAVRESRPRGADSPLIKTLRVPQQLFREASMEAGSMNPEKKTLRMSISSDTPYPRYSWDGEKYFEVLNHSPGAIDESRLATGLPILFNHDRDAHLGRSIEFANDGHKMSLAMRFSESGFAQEKMRDAMAGILPDTSVGYEVDEDSAECIGAQDGLPIYRFNWTPYEASLVTVPADVSVGVGRQRSKPEGEPKEVAIRIPEKELAKLRNRDKSRTTEKRSMEKTQEEIDQEAAAAAEQEANEKAERERQEMEARETREKELKDAEEKGAATATATATTAERQRSVEITKWGLEISKLRKIDLSEAVATHIRDGKTLAEFKEHVLRTEFTSSKPVNFTHEGGAQSITREAFNQLSPYQKSQHCLKGGKITD